MNNLLGLCWGDYETRLNKSKIQPKSAISGQTSSFISSNFSIVFQRAHSPSNPSSIQLIISK